MQKNEKNALRFGLAGGPLQAIRVLAKRLTGGYWRGDAWAVVVVEPTGTYTAANIYPGSGFGPRYNPVHYRHPVKDGLIAKKLAQGYQDVTAELPEEIREYIQLVQPESEDKPKAKTEEKAKA